MKKLIILLCTAYVLVACEEKREIIPYSVIPQPQQIAYEPGVFKFAKQVTLAYPQEFAGEASLLEEWLGEDFRFTFKTQENNADIILVQDSVHTNNKEAYILDIGKKRITLTANTSAGIVHGIQTLRQIIKPENDKYIAQTGKITDYPAFSWRAFMLDEGRYFKGKEVVFGLLDEMSRLKMNTFHWHLTNDQGWRIEIKKYPKLTEIGAFRDSSEINHFGSEVFDGKPHGGFYTQEEIREVVKYAAERHINIVPEISMPGHASAAIASYPWLGASGKQIKVPGRFGVHYDNFNIADPQVLQFLEDVIDEVIALFPGPVFHIGGDEVRYDQWKSSSSIQTYMKKHGLKTPAELQVYFTNNISNILAAKNRRMMGWNEITGQNLHDYQSKEDAHNEQKLNKDAIVHFWKGDPKLITETLENGYDIVNSYHEYTYIDYSYESIPLDKAYNFNPVPENLKPQYRPQVLGLGCQMWGEFIPTVESMNKKVYPRIAAYAETGWTAPEQKDYNRFLRSLDYFLDIWKAKGIEYGPTNKQ
ncbi:MAG: beta-N-acetylhexosaminidase [Prevotella sp.]|jgi:hexosaminidase|nr:beta-N-acetylhexosaminidase [Prevotella sp.]